MLLKHLKNNIFTKLRVLIIVLCYALVVLFSGKFYSYAKNNFSVNATGLVGDVSGDGKVDIIDIGVIIDNYRTTPILNQLADINTDGNVDIIDLGIIMDNYNRTELPKSNTSGQMWISTKELLALPITGNSWQLINNSARGNWGTADLKNQDNKYGLNVLASAFVYARTGDNALRSKTRDGIITAKRTMDDSSEWTTTNGALSLGRQLGAFVIAADLIDLKNFDSSADNEFRNWLKIIRTTDVGSHGRWKNITYTCENSANNWGTFACSSRIAASIYLGDIIDIDRSANIIRAWIGERQYYPSDAPGQNGYFQHTALSLSTGWPCNESNWVAINPSCVQLGVNVDGAIVEDAARGGNCCTLQGDGNMYSWEVLQGVFVSMELLYRTERYGNPYLWGNSGLKRAVNFMERSGWNITNPAQYVPWIANKRYGTNYPTSSTGSGRIMSWTDWTHK